MHKAINSVAINILTELERAGFEAFLVGGSVRDLLLGRKIHDYDITTNATPDDVKQIFKSVIPFGLEHGTVIVRKNNTSVEVTTYRKKTADESFTFAETIEEDLTFRDFTINAIAMDRHGNIVDLFDGQTDLKMKTIRAVVDPFARLKEDPLRMLRAIRFSSQLGFTIEENTLKAIIELKEKITNVAIERKKDEMTKLLKGKYFNEAKQYLIQTEIIKHLPIFSDNYTYIDILLKEEKSFFSFSQAITLFNFYNDEVTVNRWVKAWSCSNKEKKEAQMLLNALNEYEKKGLTNWLVYELDTPLYKPFIRLIDTIYKVTVSENDVREMKKRLSIQSRNELALTGNVLLQLVPHKKAGPWMQQLIKEIEYEVVMNYLENNEEKIKEWILCHPLVTN
jgi:tRNA nucleotidyltransferase (CCA-adding enzyme)